MFIVKRQHFLLVSLENHLASFNFQIFQGNTERYFVVVHRLRPTIKARYIRVHPRTWYGYISMRMELYGCRLGKSPKCIHVYVALKHVHVFVTLCTFGIGLVQAPSGLRKRTNAQQQASQEVSGLVSAFSFPLYTNVLCFLKMSYILRFLFVIFVFSYRNDRETILR